MIHTLQHTRTDISTTSTSTLSYYYTAPASITIIITTLHLLSVPQQTEKLPCAHRYLPPNVAVLIILRGKHSSRFVDASLGINMIGWAIVLPYIEQFWNVVQSKRVHENKDKHLWNVLSICQGSDPGRQWIPYLGNRVAIDRRLKVGVITPMDYNMFQKC